MIPMEGGGYTAPGIEDFQFTGLFGTDWITKPMVQAVIAAIIVIVVWVVAARRLRVVPTKGQYLMELLYEFIRNSVGRDILGPGFRPYLGLLVGLFTYLLLNNWFGEFFLFMFPTMSNIGYSWGAVVLVLFIYVWAGFRKHGIGYLRKALIPEGVPWYLYIIIIPVEFLSAFITRPLTLGVRLFANMFAGHLLLMLFAFGGQYLIFEATSPINVTAGVLSFLMFFMISVLELLVMFLQAYVFTLLTAMYIGEAVAESH